MKKIKIVLLFLVVLMSFKNVEAANYEIKELIPNNIKTTVKGDNLTYKGISYNKDIINIEKIINNSYEERKVTISIGLFNEKKINIGTINYCESEKLQRKDSKENITIEITDKYLGKENSKNEIKYISVIGENESCRKEGYHDFLGQKVEEIGTIKAMEKDEDATLLMNILSFIVIGLVFIFLYKVVFTTKYNNINNDDVRKAFKNNQKELEKEKVISENKKEPLEEILKEEKKSPEEQNISLEDYYK